MRVIAFSDLHAHPHKFGATIREDGRQSRLMDCVNVLDQTKQAADEFGATVRFFCGDMFHVRGKLAPSIINPVIEHFQTQRNFRDFILVGNHDMENRESGEHAVKILAPYATILEDYGFQEFTDNVGKPLQIGWVAYAPDIKALKARVKEVAEVGRAAKRDGVPSFFLLHHGVDGAMPGIPDMGFAPQDLPHEDFDWIFCGDYHKHAELVPKKAWMIGAPLQHTFGDIGQKRGWMALDTEDGSYEHVENTQAPKFVSWDGMEGSAAKGNFVRIRAEDDAVLKELAAKAEADGALATSEELVRSLKTVEKADMMLSMTTGQLFDSWLSTESEIPDDVKERLRNKNADVLAAAGIS